MAHHYFLFLLLRNVSYIKDLNLINFQKLNRKFKTSFYIFLGTFPPKLVTTT